MNMNGCSGSSAEGGCSLAPVKCCCWVILAHGCPRYSLASLPRASRGWNAGFTLCPVCLWAEGGDDTAWGGSAGQDRHLGAMLMPGWITCCDGAGRALHGSACTQVWLPSAPCPERSPVPSSCGSLPGKDPPKGHLWQPQRNQSGGEDECEQGPSSRVWFWLCFLKEFHQRLWDVQWASFAVPPGAPQLGEQAAHEAAGNNCLLRLESPI